ncbi:copper-transporting ATPase RAN1 [Olea europaea subsp. europaea]|uniref:Copper-transporting ATPase RAN1 n=1 Tax=Olea europaea subsp. europaea TaxID=158383 RepID=A0A8S0UHZ7_OLEEU|nr:copper-transporting ATPase RAN1 [Olea europaea subsp. europaea]
MGVVVTQLVEDMYFPHFGGEGPRKWLREAMKYFQLHQTIDELRLGIAEKYLEGKTYVWFYGFIANHPRANWGIFSEELCKRFAENIGEEVFVEGNIGIDVADTLKGEVVVVVEGLVKDVGNPILVTGDDWRTSQAIAKEVGITYGKVEVIPIGKADAIMSFQKGGKIVGEGKFNTTLIQPGDVFEAILDSKMPTDEYTIQSLIEEDENRPPVDEENFFEKELRLEDMIPNEDAIYESEEEHNETYVILHYLLNPRMMKTMRQSISYKENIPTLNLDDKVNLRGRDVMDWAIHFILCN